MSRIILYLVTFLVTFSLEMSLEGTQDCPMVGVDCLFHDIERSADAGTWQECAKQCAQNRLCSYWSWRTPSANINPYGCWLKSGCPFTLPDQAIVSGEYSCTQ